MELVLGCVGDLEDKRALRLVCKRTRASVDSRVVAGDEGRWPAEPLGERQLSALVRAPWQLQRLDLSICQLEPWGATCLATAAWPALQELWLSENILDAAGAASLAAAHFPALQLLDLNDNSVGDAGAALAAADWPALETMWLASNDISSDGRAALEARWPAAIVVLA